MILAAIFKRIINYFLLFLFSWKIRAEIKIIIFRCAAPLKTTQLLLLQMLSQLCCYIWNAAAELRNICKTKMNRGVKVQSTVISLAWIAVNNCFYLQIKYIFFMPKFSNLITWILPPFYTLLYLTIIQATRFCICRV